MSASPKYRTTIGAARWDDRAVNLESADDPEPPDTYQEWELVGSSLTDVRMGFSHILWFWKLKA